MSAAFEINVLDRSRKDLVSRLGDNRSLLFQEKETERYDIPRSLMVTRKEGNFVTIAVRNGGRSDDCSIAREATRRSTQPRACRDFEHVPRNQNRLPRAMHSCKHATRVFLLSFLFCFSARHTSDKAPGKAR